MKKSSVPDNTIGKVISSLNWYIACEITADEATDLTLWGDDVTVDFSDASSNTVPASIYKIVQYNNSDKALVILQCTYMDTTLPKSVRSLWKSVWEVTQDFVSARKQFTMTM